MFELNNSILDYINKTNDELFSLIKDIAKIPAPSGKEDLRVQFIKNWFENIGAKEVIVDKALNVIVPINCENNNDIIVFMAHTDVVFPDLTELPYFEDDEYIYNPGIGDDTSCLACLMMVAKYVIQNNLTSKHGILFVANSCEEGLGNLRGSRQLMEDYNGRISTVYTFDGCYNEVVNECVGSHRYELTFTTEGGHSFGAFGNRNAIAAMAELITELYKCQVPQKEGTKTTYNVGVVEGGTSVNTIAQQAKMLYEYRSDDKECLKIMQDFFNEQVEKAKATKKAEIEVKLVGDRPCTGDVDRTVLAKMTEEVINISQKYSNLPCVANSGSTDANAPMSVGVPSVCVGSHISYGTHTRGEKLLKSSMPIGFKITAEVVLKHFD